MLARMDFQAHWPGTLHERLVSAVGQLMPPLDVTSAEYIVLHELPDIMPLLLAEISVVYAHDIQGRHYYKSAHSCSGMVNMPEAEACDDGVDVSCVESAWSSLTRATEKLSRPFVAAGSVSTPDASSSIWRRLLW